MRGVSVFLTVLIVTSAATVGVAQSQETHWTASTTIRDVLQEGAGQFVLSDAMANGLHHLVWQSKRHGTEGELYHVLVNENGEIVSQPLRLTREPGVTADPMLYLSESGTLHVFFRDGRNRSLGTFHLSVVNNTIKRKPHRVAPPANSMAVAKADNHLQLFLTLPFDAGESVRELIADTNPSYDDTVYKNYFRLNHYVLNENGTVLAENRLASGKFTYSRYDGLETEFVGYGRVHAVGWGNKVGILFTRNWGVTEEARFKNLDFQKLEIKYLQYTIDGINISENKNIVLYEYSNEPGELMKRASHIVHPPFGPIDFVKSQGYLFVQLKVGTSLPRGGYHQETRRLSFSGEKWSERRQWGHFISNESVLYFHNRYNNLSIFTGAGFKYISKAPDNVKASGINQYGYPIVLHQISDGRTTISSLVPGAPQGSTSQEPASTATEPSTSSPNEEQTPMTGEESTATERSTSTSDEEQPPTTGEESTAETQSKDSDGDGVRNSKDYAPRDPDVQEMSDIQSNTALPGFGFGVAAMAVMLAGLIMTFRS